MNYFRKGPAHKPWGMDVRNLGVKQVANTGELITFEDSKWIDSLYENKYTGEMRCLAVLCSTPTRERFQLNITAKEMVSKLEAIKRNDDYPQPGYIVTGKSKEHPGHIWYDIIDVSPVK